MATIANLVVEIGGDSGSLVKEMKRVEKETKNLEESFSIFGKTAAGAFAAVASAIAATNLTDKIGNAAGKIYNVLVKKGGEIDVTSISRITKIKTNDAYSALGWLARENKIYTIEDIFNNNQIKIKLK